MAWRLVLAWLNNAFAQTVIYSLNLETEQYLVLPTKQGFSKGKSSD